MRSNIHILVIMTVLLSSLIFLTGCGRGPGCCVIKLPPVTFPSERTSLENQILGTYQEIKEDVWLVSSSQTVEGLKISRTAKTNNGKQQGIDYKVIKALETIEYNKEPVKLYKENGTVGENNEGLLSYIKNTYIENDPKEKEKVTEVVNEVNDARLVLMLEVINKNEELTIDDIEKVKKTFAGINSKNARPGEWVQNENGDWNKK